MTRASSWALPWGLSLSLFCASNAAAALDEGSKQAVRALANDAAKHFEQGQYDAAQSEFARAYEIAKVPRLAVWLARTHEKRGELVAAYELYRQALSLEPSELWTGSSQQQAQKEAERELAAITPRLARLTVRVEGDTAGVSVSVDGVALSKALLGMERLADPGQRRIVAERGAERAEQTVTLAEGARQEVILKLEGAGASRAPSAPTAANPRPASAPAAQDRAEIGAPDAPPPAKGRPLRTLGWVSVSIGAAGLGLGAVTGLMAGSKYASLKEKCHDDICSSDDAAEANSYNTLRNVSTIGFVAGGVLAAAGLTLVLTQGGDDTKPAVAVWVSPSMAGLRAKF